MAYYHQGGGYTHQNPAYHGTAEKYRNDTSVPMSNVVVSETPRYSWCTACCGLFSVWCCGLFGVCCGFLGLLCSIWSYTDHKSGDYERSSHKKKWAIGCIVLSIFLGLCVIVGILLIVFVFASDVCSLIDDSLEDSIPQLRDFCNTL